MRTGLGVRHHHRRARGAACRGRAGAARRRPHGHRAAPGAFSGNTAQWAGSIRADGAVGLPYPRSTTAAIHESDIADVAVALLTAAASDAERTGRGGDLDLTGPESLSFAEQVDVLSRELGREVGVREIDPATAQEQMARYAPPAIVESLFALWRAGDGVPSRVTDAVPRLTGHPARTFAEWVRDHREMFADDAAPVGT